MLNVLLAPGFAKSAVRMVGKIHTTPIFFWLVVLEVVVDQIPRALVKKIRSIDFAENNAKRLSVSWICKIRCQNGRQK